MATPSYTDLGALEAEGQMLGARQLSRLKTRIRSSNLGRDTGSALTQFDSLIQAIQADPSRKTGIADAKVVSDFLGTLKYTSQDYQTKAKEFQYGSLILNERALAARDKLAAFQGGNYAGDVKAATQALTARADLFQKQAEASQGFAGLMDLSGQAFEGNAGAFTDTLTGLSKAVQLRQSLGGTYLSAAGAAQAAAAQEGLKTAVKAGLTPLLGEAGAASRESGYTFNLAGLAPEESKAWGSYFDARLKAQDLGGTFNPSAWAAENPEAAAMTVARPGERVLGRSSDFLIPEAAIDSVDARTGKVTLKGSMTGQRTDDLQRRLDAAGPGAILTWQGSGANKTLRITSEREQLSRIEKSQTFAWKAPERLGEMVTSYERFRAGQDIREAKKIGYDPRQETLDQFKVRTAPQSTVVRR